MKPIKIYLFTFLTAFFLVSQFEDAAAQQIVRLDPRFDRLVPRDAMLEKIADPSHFPYEEARRPTRPSAAIHHTPR